MKKIKGKETNMQIILQKHKLERKHNFINIKNTHPRAH
jgi:hypothetical protein